MSSATPNTDQLLQSAMSLHQAGRLREAEGLYRQILQQTPQHAEALHLLGALAAQVNRPDQAVELIRQAIALQPHFPDAYNNLGGILVLQGQSDAALVAFRQALAQQPDHAEACANLGQALLDQGQFEASAAACRRAIELNPHFPLAHNNLGNALRALGQTDQAIAAYRQAIALRPDYADTYNNLGDIFQDNHQLAEAIAAYRQVVALSPDSAIAHNNLANTLNEAGYHDESLANFRQALVLHPDCTEAHSNLLFTLHHNPAHDAQTIADEHRQWNRLHARPLKHLIRPHGNSRDPNRRLKIGYVSPDFRNHSVAPMVLPLIQQHDRTGFEVFCYAQVAKPDAMVARFQQHADHWRSTVGLTDEQVAEQIRQDQIDILVDLAGHTGGNRLLVFARKPAPVQVTRQGHPNTTGLETMDYRMTDTYADPPGLSDTLHTEKLIRLPQTNWIYQPPPDEAAVPVGPFRADVPVTFGCFNNFAKVTAPMLHLWARILAAVPDTRLLLKATALGVEDVRQRVRKVMDSHTISPERLILLAATPTAVQHMRLYHDMTIALDPFPYHGTTTTCEALWMGVPVITLAGQTHVSRVGVSLLTNVGTPELIAQTPEEYLRLAVNLATDRPRLAHLHATLRQMLQSSPIMDYPGFARHIEAAYRQMWRHWCAAAQ